MHFSSGDRFAISKFYRKNWFYTRADDLLYLATDNSASCFVKATWA
jgi:hypothetical protein